LSGSQQHPMHRPGGPSVRATLSETANGRVDTPAVLRPALSLASLPRALVRRDVWEGAQQDN